MLPVWEQRSIITASLLNPAFCGEAIRLASVSFQKKHGKNIPFPLVFIILPLVLHKKTRESLPGSSRTKLHDWLSSNDELKIGMAERIKYLVPYTRESILFLYRYNILSFDEQGCIKTTGSLIVKSADILTDEVQDIFNKSIALGRWMATFPRESMVFTMLGIQP